MLKFKLTASAYDSLSDAEKTFYKKDGDDYTLQVEGAVDKSKLDEFRSNNVELLKQTEKFKDVDLEKYNAMLEQEKKIRDKELIDKGDIDTIISERTAAIQSDYDAKLQKLTGDLDAANKNYNSVVSKYEIEGAAHKAFSSHKISPDAQEAVMAQIRTKFTIDNGSVVARDGDKILTGSNGNLTIDEFVASQPEIFKIQSNGGRAAGAKGKSTNDDFSDNSRSNISEGLRELRK